MPLNDSEVTIMLVRNSGKVRSVKIEIRKLILLGVGFLCLIAGFIVVLYGWISLSQEHYNLLAMTKNMDIAGVSGYIEKEAAAENVPVDTVTTLEEGVSIEESQEESIPGETALLLDIKEKFIPEKSILSDSISITEFRIERRKDQPGIRIKFNLNNSKGTGSISGYLTVFAEFILQDKKVFKSYPEDNVNENGKVKDFRQGDWFSISRFKVVSGKIDYDPDSLDFDNLWICVFSTKGDLMLKVYFERMQPSA